MRQIKFRGQSLYTTHDWKFGSFIYFSDKHYIFQKTVLTISAEYRIIPETVGQFTGLTDRNGVEIYENDIIYFLIDNEKYAVEFHEGAFCLVSENINVSISMYDFDNSEYEVIGNIHDNPELL